MQFRAQDQYYRAHYANASYAVIVVDGQPAGRLYVDRGSEAILVIDIALLSAFRGQGIGTRLLEDLQAEAATVSKPIRIHVERFNVARRLYERLGFRLIEDQGVYLFLEWSPDGKPSPAGQEKTTS